MFLAWLFVKQNISITWNRSIKEPRICTIEQAVLVAAHPNKTVGNILRYKSEFGFQYSLACNRGSRKRRNEVHRISIPIILSFTTKHRNALFLILFILISINKWVQVWFIFSKINLQSRPLQLFFRKLHLIQNARWKLQYPHCKQVLIHLTLAVAFLTSSFYRFHFLKL